VDNLRRPERLVPLLEDLGRRHARYGVEPGHFDAVGDALLGALSELDPGWSEAVAAAWRGAYARIAEAMARGLAGEHPTLASGSARRVIWEEQELEPPRTRYAKSGEVNLAYQVLGGGPIDLVLVIGWLTHVEVGWEWPPRARFLRGLASLGRLVVFDARGTGLSDPIAHAPLLEDRADDLRAVMNAAGVERAALIGLGAGVATSVLFAATHPERVRALVLYGGSARRAVDPEDQTRVREQIRASWGEPLFLDRLAPSLADDPPFRRWWARFLRTSASLGAALAHHRSGTTTDVRALLPVLRAPTLVLRRDGDAVSDAGEIRYLAQHIPGATIAELPGADHLPFVGDTGAILERVRDFLISAAVLAQPADDGWLVSAVVSLVPCGAGEVEDAPVSARDLADPLRLLCEREIARFRGVELDGPGPGRAAAMFDGPSRAVGFSRAVLAQAAQVGVELAAGVCCDACRLGETEVDGAAVHLAPAVAARAEPGEVLVTGPARALLEGAGLSFAARGALEGGVELFAALGDPA
jgi:pimeloyl-ACP methyl ester carboxylesterase